MGYVYTEDEKKRISKIAMNAANAMHLPELVRRDRAEIKRLQGLPDHTPALAAIKKRKIDSETEKLNEHLDKIKLYRQCFPGIYV